MIFYHQIWFWSFSTETDDFFLKIISLRKLNRKGGIVPVSDNSLLQSVYARGSICQHMGDKCAALVISFKSAVWTLEYIS